MKSRRISALPSRGLPSFLLSRSVSVPNTSRRHRFRCTYGQRSYWSRAQAGRPELRRSVPHPRDSSGHRHRPLSQFRWILHVCRLYRSHPPHRSSLRRSEDLKYQTPPAPQNYAHTRHNLHNRDCPSGSVQSPQSTSQAPAEQHPRKSSPHSPGNRYRQGLTPR